MKALFSSPLRSSAGRRWLTQAIGMLAITLLAYTAYRATTLSMTHDESTSYNWFHATNVLTCFSSPDCWPNANNHLLNTWAWQQSIRLFGVSEWAIRLPNLLAHGLYLLCSVAIVRSATRRFWVGLAGFALINFNPYLLEFFGLARGYGLAAGLSMGSIYALFRFLRHGRWPALLGSYLLAALAVLAHFAALQYLASLWGTVFLMSLLRPERQGFHWREQLWKNAIPLALSLLLALLLYRPVQYLQATGDFDRYGTSSFIAAFRSVVESGLYGVGYFSKATVPVFGLAYAAFLLPALAGAFWFYAHAPEQAWRRQYLATALLFLLSALVMTAQHHLLGSNYLEGRKALLFITLSGLLFFFFLQGLAEEYLDARMARLAGFLVFAWLSYHLLRAGNLSYSQEWRYDRNTREMVRYLDAAVPPGQGPVRLGVTDLFQPTVTFYHETRGLRAFTPPPYHQEVYADGRYDYYFVRPEQAPLLEEGYRVEKQWEEVWLLRRQDVKK